MFVGWVEHSLKCNFSRLKAEVCMDSFFRYAQYHDVIFPDGMGDSKRLVAGFNGAECAVSAVKYLARGDRGRLLMFIQQVRSVNRSDVDLLLAAVDARDRTWVAKCAHKILGSAGVFKYESLVKHCGFMESACVNESWVVLVELSKRIKWLICQLDKSLAVLIAEEN